MNKLIDISGYVENEADLNKVSAYEGEFYNVLDPAPFCTYRKTEDKEISDLHQSTDIIGWFENKVELDNIKPNNNDVYIVGISAPYTRWKANVHGIDIKWEEDGSSDIKIVKRFTSAMTLNRAHLEPDPEEFYSVGRTAPFELYGENPSWEPVGLFISYNVKTLHEVNFLSPKIGEIVFCQGFFYLYIENGWKQLNIIEPFENYKKHIYKTQNNDSLIAIREGFKLGTLEFFEPKDI